MTEPLWLDILVALLRGIVVGAFGLMWVILWWGIRPARRRRRIRERMLVTRPHLSDQGKFYPVNYTSRLSTCRFVARKSPLWDATGLLVVADDEVVCICVSLKTHEEFELRFKPKKSTVEWFGPERLILQRRSWHWLRIEHEGRSHCFTDDTTWKAWRSRDNTWALYEELRRVLGT